MNLALEDHRTFAAGVMGYLDPLKPPRSAYLHIPFCHRRCFYCDFVVVPLGDKASGENGPGSSAIKSYLNLLHREIAVVPEGAPLATVYIGGGTPSLLTPSQISSLLGHLENHFGFQDGVEITMEIDPASFSLESLKGFVDVGITRISLGGQSFDDLILERLGRRHRRSHLLEACQWLNDFYRSGWISTWSLDLIQCVPGMSLCSWEKELNQAIDTSAPHLAIYDLSIEAGTVFAWKQSRGELELLDHDLAADIMRATSSVLSKVGFARYEISNYALPGHASRHNRVYWSGAGWWGFGQGATSAPWGERFARPRTRDTYRTWIEDQEQNGVHPSLEVLTACSMTLDEQLMVGLRRREGIDFYALARRWGWSEEKCDFYVKLFCEFMKDSLEGGLLKREGSRFRLSEPKGMELSNQTLIQMLRWWDSLPQNVVVQPIPAKL